MKFVTITGAILLIFGLTMFMMSNILDQVTAPDLGVLEVDFGLE